MTNEFQKELIKRANKTSKVATTENGAKCYNRSKSDVFDLYIQLAKLRNETNDKIKEVFEKALAEDASLTMKAMFYARDIRGAGLGERRVFRELMINLLNSDFRDEGLALCAYIPEIGRWDDVIEVATSTRVDEEYREVLLGLISSVLDSEVGVINGTIEGEISLLGKWLPSINASSKETRRKAFALVSFMYGNTHRESQARYRKICSKLRSHIGIVEKKMCAGEWDKIEHSKLPSYAFKKYISAFWRHTPEKMEKLVKKIEKGEATINSGVLYPYDIVSKLCDYWYNNNINNRIGLEEDVIATAQLKGLPNYVEENQNIMVVMDSSGSMHGKPMATAFGLGIYFANRNTGVWHNKAMTFSSEPHFIEFKGNSVAEDLSLIPSIVEDTDIDKVFKLLYKTAKASGEEVPNIVIITDMQFNSGTKNSSRTIFEKWQKKFEENGMTMPNITYWDVSNYRISLQNKGEKNQYVQYVNGHSVGVFNSVINGIGKTRYQAMVDVLNKYTMVDYIISLINNGNE